MSDDAALGASPSTRSEYFDPETLSRLKLLSLRGRHLIDGYVAGRHRSLQRGQSIEFSEHRQYSPGDDVRRVDWKVYARSDQYFVKQYEDETNLACVVALDTSNSMQYRGAQAPLSKLEYAQLVTLSLAYTLLEKRDTVAMATFSDAIDQFLEPSNQVHRWKDMIPFLEKAPQGDDTRLDRIFGELSAKLSRRSLVIVVSDLLDDLERIAKGCRWLRHQRNSVVLIQILDRDEVHFPFRRLTTFQAMEGREDLYCDASRVQTAYLKRFAAHQRGLRRLAMQQEMDMATIVTDQSLAVALPQFIARRQAGAGRGGSVSIVGPDRE
jgi:uncharacterized protein (DUF58 family)